MRIVLDKFLDRQFDPNFSGTVLKFDDITDHKSHIDHTINTHYTNIQKFGNVDLCKLVDADPQMPFCKYLITLNNMPIKKGTIKITPEITPYIKTEYKSRNEDELPVLSRYVDLPNDYELPDANFLVYILYSKDQLRREFKGDIDEFDSIYTEDVEYGCIAILGTENNEPDPMPPITIMRNALGIDEGGNGVKLDRDQYEKSIEFWSNNILIK